MNTDLQGPGVPRFHATILSLFPEMFPGPLGFSVAKRALDTGIWSYQVVNIRDFGLGASRKVDDMQYGGSGGAVLRADVLGAAIDKHLGGIKRLYSFSPRGKPITQKLVEEVIAEGSVMLLCGRFEGIDERVIEEYGAQEISLGDFVLSGGEIAALALLDACVRQLPGALAKMHIAQEDSFGSLLADELEYPLYTRPSVWKGRAVPDVLLRGNHRLIDQWKKQQSRAITSLRRRPAPEQPPG